MLINVFNVLWFRDITDAGYLVVTNVWEQTTGALTKLSITYIEVGQSLKFFITNGIGGFVNILLIPVNVTIQLVCLFFTVISKILTVIGNVLTYFYNAISRGINSFFDFLRRFFGGGGGPFMGGNIIDSIQNPPDTILAINATGIPGVYGYRRYSSNIPICARRITGSGTETASSPIEIISEVSVIMDVVVPVASEICGIILLSVLLAPIAPYIHNSDVVQF